MNYELARASVMREKRPYVYNAQFPDGSRYIGSTVSGLKNPRMWGTRLYTQKTQGAVDFSVEFFDSEESARRREDALIQHLLATGVRLRNIRVPLPKHLKLNAGAADPFYKRVGRRGFIRSDFHLEA